MKKTNKKLFPLKLLLLSLINGGIIGLFITLFLKVVYLAEETSAALAEFLKSNLWLIPIYLLVFMGVAFLVSYLSKFEKFTRGGGMPQTEGLIRDVLHLRWYYAIPIVTICSLLAIACGISLDNEGPSVLIGACIGMMVTKLFNQNFFVEKYLIVGGSGAGLATAFNMPLTGVLFSLEEGSKRFSPMLLLTSTASVFSAIAVSNLLMERSPMFAPIEIASQMHWSAYVVLFFVGIVLGLVATLFSKSILKLTEFFNANKYFKNGRAMFLPFIILIPCMLFLPEVMGPGVELINKTFEGTFLLWSLVVLLVVKFAFTALSSSTSLIGGIFIPSLAIEGLAGALLGSIVNQILPANNINIDIFVLAGMVVAFTSIAGSPITAVVFSVELSQNFNIFFPMICVVLGALLIGQIVKSDPIYEAQLWQMRKAQGEHEHEAFYSLDILVEENSNLDEMLIRDIILPGNCIIADIKRGEETITPDAESKIRQGDILTFNFETREYDEYVEKLHSMTK